MWVWRIWVRGLAVVLLAAAVAALAPVRAAAQGEDVCSTAALAKAQVTASVVFHYRKQDYARLDSTFVAVLPADWKRAPDLLLSQDTERFRSAMRCVLRDAREPEQRREDEWRPRSPRVELRGGRVVVTSWAQTWISGLDARDFGVWRVEPGVSNWRLSLLPPPALRSAWWKQVTVDAGAPARSLTPLPASGTRDSMTWTSKKPGPPPPVTLLIEAPAVKASTAAWNNDLRYLVGGPLSDVWDVVVMLLVLGAVRRLRSSPSARAITPAEERTTRVLRAGTRVLLVLSVLSTLDDAVYDAAYMYLRSQPSWTTYRFNEQLLLSTVMGLLLCGFGRPRRSVTAAVLAAASFAAAVACFPATFGLPATLWLDGDHGIGASRRDSRGWFVWLAVACACLMFVWLVGIVCSALRITRAYAAPGLAAPSAGRFRLRFLALLAALSAGLVAAGVWASEREWSRISWLSDEHGSRDYGSGHRVALLQDLAWLPSDWPDWIVPDWWVLTTLGLVVVLRARAAAPGASVVAPGKAEWFAVRVLFVTGVALANGWYAGVPVEVVSLPVTWLTISAVGRLGRRAAVLNRPITAGVALREAVRETHRRAMLDAARRYRDLHGRLRRADQGQEMVRRRTLERALDRLHRWRAPAAAPWARRPLPASVTPVDLALAWGPRATWWDNGRRAALFAALTGVPATLVMVWAVRFKGSLGHDMLSERLGLLSVPEAVVVWQVTWTAGGFVLGALWRTLPGHRGPTRAAVLWLAFALPPLADRVVTQALAQDTGTTLLVTSLMLLVLTVTGAAMDVDTFRGERQYWPTRAGLLLSLFQLRTASVQIAFLLAQVGALLSIWQQVHHGASGAPDSSLLPNKDAASGGGS